MQYRGVAGATTTAVEVDLTPSGLDIDEDSVALLRLEVSAGGPCARGYASPDRDGFWRGNGGNRSSQIAVHVRAVTV